MSDYLKTADEALDLVDQLGEKLTELAATAPEDELEWVATQGRSEFDHKTRDCLKVVETRLHTAANSYRRWHGRKAC